MEHVLNVLKTIQKKCKTLKYAEFFLLLLFFFLNSRCTFDFDVQYLFFVSDLKKTSAF